MCGIAGIVGPAEGLHGQDLSEAVARMVVRMAPRGPDATAVWIGPGCAIGHRRLAILDLDPRANQPMTSSDGRLVISFNGEIYNYRDLRRELESQGVAFRTSSDTEVLLALFAREGEAMLPKLRGMFAFAILDTVSGELFLARDPYGIKPLYYTRARRGFVFASQVKALLASGIVAREPEPAGLAGFYLWGSVPEPWTLYRGVFALPAGYSMRVLGGEMKSRCWYDIRSAWRCQGRGDSLQATQDAVRLALRESVRAHLTADVPVSIFLSGGVDSAVIAGLACELGAAVEGITIGFQEFAGRRHDEVPVAATVAAHYGMTHTIRMISRAEFEDDVPRILDAMDQPSIDGVNTWFASKAAAERGYKVVLSGVGGDELFHGYSLFQEIPREVAWARRLGAVPGSRGLVNATCRLLARYGEQPKLAGLPDFMGSLEGVYFLRRGLFLPDELSGIMHPDLAIEGLARLGGTPPGMSAAAARDGAAAVGLLESTLYLRNQLLRDSDWASMAHSVELRTPLVDVALLEAVGPRSSAFANGAGKRMLAQAPIRSLPDAISARPKTGFGLPMSEWLGSGLAPRPPRVSWARHWATTVVQATNPCG